MGASTAQQAGLQQFVAIYVSLCGGPGSPSPSATAQRLTSHSTCAWHVGGTLAYCCVIYSASSRAPFVVFGVLPVASPAFDPVSHRASPGTQHRAEP